MFADSSQPTRYVAMSDPDDPLSSYAPHPFELDGAEWPSAEHYFQAMKFEDPELREAIRAAADPKTAATLANGHKRKVRKDWKKVRTVFMTRALYTQCHAHPAVARALLDTGEKPIVETSQYDYFWGCGRDQRGENAYGKILMDIREKLRRREAQ